MAGWLDLSYKNRYSRRREHYLLSVLEEQEVAKSYDRHALIHSIMGAITQNQKQVSHAFELLEAIQALTLPYTVAKAKIKDEPGTETISKEQIAHWKTVLAEKAAAYAKKQKTEKK